MRKPIQIKGISTTSSYEDGECLDMMNVRHEQGVLKPVEVFPTDFTLKNVYSLLYWHKNNSYTHLIGVRNNNVYWIKDKVTEIITNKEYTIVNAVYIDGKTTFQLSQSIAPDLNIGDKLISIDGIPKEQNLIVNINNYSDEISFDGNLTNDYYPGAPIIIGMVSFQTEMMADEVWLLQLAINKNVVISHIGNLINVLDDTVLKYILWKNTMYILYEVNFDGNKDDDEIFSKIDIFVEGVVSGTGRVTRNYISRDTSNESALSLLEKALSIENKDGHLTGFCLAASAIQLYDGSFICLSAPVLLGQAFDTGTRYVGYDSKYGKSSFEFSSIIDDLDTGEDYSEMNVTNIIKYTGASVEVVTDYPNFIIQKTSKLVLNVGYNTVKVRINQIPQQYENLIKSISIFMTPQVHQYYFDKLINTTNGSIENRSGEVKSNDQIIKELLDFESMYLVHDVQITDLTADDYVSILDLDGKLGENLLTQKKLKLNSFSNIKAENQITYNSMIHVWNVKNIISRGYPYDYFRRREGETTDIRFGQFFSEYEPVVNSNITKWVQVKIKTNDGVVQVVRGYENVFKETDSYGSLTPAISYPDKRAIEITLFHKWGNLPENISQNTFNLTPSATGNFSCYISSDLKPINDMKNEYIPFPQENNQETRNQNKLKVSNTNNPFLFPDDQTYQIGDGSILNVASQSIRTSDGQFGQFPLICFCTDGVFSLEVGDGTVAYSRQVKPQSYERPISKVICTTPFGILFISNRGLCMVAGQDVIYLSETMFEKFRNITLELPTSIASSFSFDTGLFNDYLKDCSAMVYNPKEQEVIIINPNKEFNYVYNFSTKQFYKNDEQITNEINNSLPSLQVWKGLLVKNVTRTEAGQRKITFTTRPIKMQTTDFKRFERVILRGYLSQLSGAVACIWGSIDDRNFKLLRGITLTDNTTRKDLDFGMFGKTTYRSYIIGLSMTVGTDSEIEAIEMEIEKLYNNTNMQ